MKDVKITAVDGTHNDISEISDADKIIRIRTWEIVEYAVKFLRKCSQKARDQIIDELSHPNK